jgi:hypothetical protein
VLSSASFLLTRYVVFCAFSFSQVMEELSTWTSKNWLHQTKPNPIPQVPLPSSPSLKLTRFFVIIQMKFGDDLIEKSAKRLSASFRRPPSLLHYPVKKDFEGLRKECDIPDACESQLDALVEKGRAAKMREPLGDGL